MGDILYIFEDLRGDSSETCRVFRDPIKLLSTPNPAEVENILKQVEVEVQSGYYAAGYLAYEAALGFAKNKKTVEHGVPLVKFYLFENMETVSFDDLRGGGTASEKRAVYNFRENWDFNIYQNKFLQLKEKLLAGECYQLNLSMRQTFEFLGEPFDLYACLREQQKVSYAAYLKDQSQAIISFSPELFVKRRGNHLITKPMKGTSARSPDIEIDEKNKFFLQTDEKSRAENVMIVDLLRNDLGKLAIPGTVEVNNLFEIQSFETLHQMITTVSAEISPKLGLIDIFKALFPCGSITGAPKVRTMQLIEELEEQPRGIYTGAIGYIEPNQNFCFNVAIRTVEQTQSHQYRVGLGGGVLVDSEASAEYKECLLKGKFIKNLNRDFSIFESLFFDGEHFKNVSGHRERLRRSCQYFGFNWSDVGWNQILQEVVARHVRRPGKVKIEIDWSGDFRGVWSEISKIPSEILMSLSDHQILRNDPFVYHKTSNRSVYEREWESGRKQGHYDKIFFNDREELTEASRHNIFLLIDNQWWTPPVKCGLLAGVERDIQMVEKSAKERILYREDLRRAKKIALTNSVRGWVEVDEVVL